jgi:hypothetical protein
LAGAALTRQSGKRLTFVERIHFVNQTGAVRARGARLPRDHGRVGRLDRLHCLQAHTLLLLSRLLSDHSFLQNFQFLLRLLERRRDIRHFGLPRLGPLNLVRAALRIRQGEARKAVRPVLRVGLLVVVARARRRHVFRLLQSAGACLPDLFGLGGGFAEHRRIVVLVEEADFVCCHARVVVIEHARHNHARTRRTFLFQLACAAKTAAHRLLGLVVLPKLIERKPVPTYNFMFTELLPWPVGVTSAICW